MAVSLPWKIEGASLSPRCPDVSVDFASVPVSIEGTRWVTPYCQAKPQLLWLNVPNVGRYLVREGKTITIDPAPEASHSDLETFLMTSAMGALLLQRGFLVLHGSAVSAAKGAIIFLGNSGTGKSQLAYRLCQLKGTLISDELCVVSLSQKSKSGVLTGPSSITLWRRASGRPIRTNVPRYRISMPECPQSLTPLDEVYILRSWNRSECVVEEAQKYEKLTNILSHVYNPLFVRGLGLDEQVFRQATAMAQLVKALKLVKIPYGKISSFQTLLESKIF